MIFGPRPNDRVQLHYAKRFAHLWPLHGKIGVVRIVSKGGKRGTVGPRNLGVEIDGRIVVVPVGNLRRLK